MEKTREIENDAARIEREKNEFLERIRAAGQRDRDRAAAKLAEKSANRSSQIQK